MEAAAHTTVRVPQIVIPLLMEAKAILRRRGERRSNGEIVQDAVNDYVELLREWQAESAKVTAKEK